MKTTKWYTSGKGDEGDRKLTRAELAELRREYGSLRAAKRASLTETSGTGWIAHPTCRKCFISL
jgi:hypothetical protein